MVRFIYSLLREMWREGGGGDGGGGKGKEMNHLFEFFFMMFSPSNASFVLLPPLPPIVCILI